MKKPRAYPASIRGVSRMVSRTPIVIDLDILDPNTAQGRRGSTVRLTADEARMLVESLSEHLALVEQAAP